MKKIYFYLSTLVLVLFVGCNDSFLDEVHPTKKTSAEFLTTDKDAQEAATNLYSYFTSSINRYGNGFLATFDILRGDELTLPINFGSNALIQWLTLNYNPETTEVQTVWAKTYKTIFNANSIIDNVTGNTAVGKQALAEAYAMRGYCYFNLTRLFGEVPLMLHQTTPDTYYPVKASEEECWAQVFSDYEKALQLGIKPPVKNYVDGRLNSGSVNALMARAYLLRTRPGSDNYWDKVKEYTDAVEKLGIYELEPFSDSLSIYVYTKGDKWVYNKEVIWAEGQHYGPILGGATFRYDDYSDIGTEATMPNGLTTYTIKNEVGTIFLPGNGGFSGITRYAVSNSFADEMIKYDALGDKRTRQNLYYPTYNSYKSIFNSKTLSFTIAIDKTFNAADQYAKAKETDGAQGEYIHIQKYKIREFYGKNIYDGGWHYSLMMPIIRYADVLLMRAEAEYHLGNQSAAKNYLKKITDRAGFAANYVDGFSDQALLDEILNQRRVELFFEGTRFSDLIRLDMFKPPYVGSYKGSQPWNNKFSVLPIPQRELDINQNLIQNELWR